MAAQTPEPIPEQILIAALPNRPVKHTGRPQKGAPQYRQLLLLFFIPRIANLLRSISSFFLFLPVYLLAAALSTPCRHTILTLAVVYPLHD